MTWRPASNPHAIERVRFLVTFERPAAPKKIRRLGLEMDKRRAELGFEPMVTQEGVSMTFQLTPAGPVAVPQSEPLGRWDFNRNSADGLTVEALVMAGGNLVYETSEYARWPVFLDRLLLVAQPVIDKLVEDDDPSSVALEYHDLFWYDGPMQDARPSAFLRNVATALQETPMESGELWHIHRGWYEPHGPSKLLIQQNIDAQDGQIDGGDLRRIVRLVTRAEAKKGMWDIADSDLRPHLDLMHDRTNAVFSAILTENMQRQIGFAQEGV